MRRLWIAFVVLLLSSFAPPAQAQGGFTTVTGTITGALDGLVWSCGTISAQLITAGGASPTLNGGGFSTSTSPIALGCPTTNALPAGSFSMRLADSGVIVPSNTTWQFTVNMAPGIAPPAGTGSQSFTFTTAINCSTNTPSTCTANSLSISSQLSALAPRLSNSTAGTGSGTIPGVIDVTGAPFNVKTGFFVTDVTVTNGLNTISCPNSDCNFTSSMNGWLVAVTNMTSDASAMTSVVVMPSAGNTTCTFTFVSAQSGTCSANSGQSIVGAAVLSMVPADQSAGMIAAQTAAAKAGFHVQIPDGVIGLAACIPDPIPTGKKLGDNAGSGGVATAFGMTGWTKTTSILWLMPGASGTTATGGPAANSCFGGASGATYYNFEITAFGNSALGASFNNKNIMEITAFASGNSTSRDVYIMAIGSATTGTIGLLIDKFSGAYIWDHFVDGGGATCMFINAGPNPAFFVNLYGSVAGNCPTTSLRVVAGTVTTNGGTYGNNITGGVNGTLIDGSTGGVDFRSSQDIFDYNSGVGGTNAANVACLAAANPVSCWFDEDRIHAPNGAVLNALSCTGAAQCFISNSRVVSDAGSALIESGTTGVGQMVNVGGNLLNGAVATVNCQGVYIDNQPTALNVGSTAAFFANANCKYNSSFQSVIGICTGTAGSSATDGLYGTGPNVTTTPCSTTVGTGNPMQRSGTVYALLVTVSATGSTAGSGVFTVSKNGGAQTMTCTVGNVATTCFDIAHNFTYVQGDRISVSFTTGAAETLANPVVQLVVE